MTIKPLINQKNSEKKDSHGHQESQNANLVVANVRGNHRNGIVSKPKPTVEGQSSQRRNDVFEDINRHRRSPLKSTISVRSKREHHKREQREKVCSSPQYHQIHSPHSIPSCGANKSPKHCTLSGTGSVQPQSSNNKINLVEESFSGYNSGDEHLVQKDAILTPNEWKDRDEQFMKGMSQRGFIIKDIIEDGACLFRAISLQIYGDQEMHEVIRQQTMDYIYQNREYFAHFVTEDITSYVKRKRNKESHGNHIEIQAMSEMYNRAVELYCYKTTPTNIFNSEQINNGYDPLRLSYQRGSHYNAIIDPYNASVGVGLGLAGYKPESQTREAIRLSEQLEIEKTMFEDKLKTTDWEATNEAIEEQIARESYLQWCRDNMQSDPKTTTTITASSSTMSSSSSNSNLPSTVTSSAMKSLDNCTASNSKDQLSQYHLTAPNTSSSDSNLSRDLLISKPNLTETDCCESDETDLGNTSSSAEMYKDKIQLSRLNKSFKFGKKCSSSSSCTGNCSARRLKRRHREAEDAKNDSASSSTINPCLHKRVKHSKKPAQQKKHQQLIESTQQHSEILSNYSGVPCTSKQAIQIDKPLSSFYQSLLESSYADDGIGQLSENEMVMKAIRISRMDFFQTVKRQHDEEININNRDVIVNNAVGSAYNNRNNNNDDDSDIPSP